VDSEGQRGLTAMTLGDLKSIEQRLALQIPEASVGNWA
jgi:hypothetical protein